jgi:hypothetical protein
MARIKLTKLPEGQVRISTIDSLGGTEVESQLDGVVQVIWSASPQGSSFQLLFAPDAVIIAEELHPVEQALHDSEAQAKTN